MDAGEERGRDVSRSRCPARAGSRAAGRRAAGGLLRRRRRGGGRGGWRAARRGGGGGGAAARDDQVLAGVDDVRVRPDDRLVRGVHRLPGRAVGGGYGAERVTRRDRDVTVAG